MNSDSVKQFYKQKRVLVTGACGTVGYELTRQLLEQYPSSEIIAIDNNESELFFLQQKFLKNKKARFFLADIRDREKMIRLMRGVQILFHTAAYKHVLLCERSPFEAVQTNILGVQNVISAAIENGLERVIFTSSDKAVNPTNVMGTSKLMAERLLTAANNNLRGDGPIFSSTRFGNVLGSRGSVIPIFREQIKSGGPVTLTDPEMTRFIMSIQEAVRLVITSAILACGGEVFITKMPVIRIKDLAEIMIKELSPSNQLRQKKLKIEIIGPRPGEKMFEELMNGEETRRAWELDQYFVVLPAFQGIQRKITYRYRGLVNKKVTNPYQSNQETPLNRHQLSLFLKNNHLLEEE
ncbi:MAG: SDR family NAD(P)-dependent oxidoreductase [Deltaproteobacteria bacterium]|nr:SDR family NAD(P)-dependent oxidoreductase [Deltaproteobacteria bacterium]